jgi:hypothetical protein
MIDWADSKARSIVAPFRPLFKEEAGAHTIDGLINVLAGELRAAEGNARRQAVAAGEDLLAALQRLTCR